MALQLKQLRDGGIQVEDGAGHWILFTLDELRSHTTLLPNDRIDGAPPLPEAAAELFVWSAFAAARGYAQEHGLIAAG